MLLDFSDYVEMLRLNVLLFYSLEKLKVKVKSVIFIV